jgi:nitrogenase iron protein NifH
MRHIAVYGKGGIGKSTTSQNMAVALGEMGKKILIIGCDPKADCSRLILHRSIDETVLDLVREESEVVVDDIVHKGAFGIDCIESGGPEPGVGCAGRGIITALGLVEQLDIFKRDYDFVFYDVLGDVVCGGFAMPIREGYAEEIYIVTSGEFMALYAANNICRGIIKFADQGKVRLGGLICNSRLVDNEMELVESMAKRLNTKVVKFVPRDNIVQYAENEVKTVIEYDSKCEQADHYRELAKNILVNKDFVIPTPMNKKELNELFLSYQKSETKAHVA